jgi:Tol biopolymer transport system component
MERPAPSVAEVAPEALDRVLRTCLEKDPELRFQNARDLKRDLLWATEQRIESPAKASRALWPGIAAAALIAAIAGAVFMHFRQPAAAEERPLRLSLAPPEGGRFVPAVGHGGGLTLSPDGRYAAFVADVNGKTALWLRSLEGAKATPLPGTEGATMPFWSPDSRSLGFIAANKLLRIDIGGQGPQMICDVQANTRAGMWTSNGMIVFEPNDSGLARVPASGGTPTRFTSLDSDLGENGHMWPQVLPGRNFLYFSRTDRAQNQGVYAASLDTPANRVRVLTSTSSPFIPRPIPQGERRTDICCGFEAPL